MQNVTVRPMTTLTKKQQAQAEKDEALARLHELLKPGDTVHTILRHVSQSGMLRAISPVICGENGPFDIGYLVGRACGMKHHERHGGLKLGGCGMDMGFSLVYGLSRTMFPDGFGCIGRDDEARIYCPSNDHSNGDRDFTIGHPHVSGGYAIQQRWL